MLRTSMRVLLPAVLLLAVTLPRDARAFDALLEV